MSIKKVSDKPTMTIDLEPTWEQLCGAAQSGALRPIELLPACKIADIVRQAQKAGKEKVVFTFENGEVSVEVA